MLRRRLSVATILLCFLSNMSACLSTQFFPPEVVDGVDSNFDFSRWRMLPNQIEEHKIQLGGQIVQSDSKGDILRIVAIMLPIVKHPAYGPKDTKQRTGEFTILYHGKIDPLFLQEGNRLIVVGYTRPPIKVGIDDIPRTLPTMTAQCIHIWNTGGSEIADYSSSGAGYEALREETYCEGSPEPSHRPIAR